MSSYEALYRKYRPQTFRDLAGQDPVASTLRNEVRSGHLGHAYLFTGPRGTGKTTTARLLAKALNCVRGPTPDPCDAPVNGTRSADPTDECLQCQAIRLGSHIDVVEVDAASNRGIDDIRSLQERVRLAPVQGRYKVFIIDEVHMLSPQAWNALLKTLEEPPPGCVFIMATTEVDKVLPTVLSRCQRFDFQRIAHPRLVERLVQVARAEDLDVEPAALELLARRADGGLRDALSLLDQVAAGLRGTSPESVTTITAALVTESLGLIPADAVAAIGDALAARDAASAIVGCNELLAAGHDHRAILRELLGWVRNVMLLQLAPDRADALEIPPGQRERIQRQVTTFSHAELLFALEILRQTDQALKNSAQPTIWLEMGILQLCDRAELPSLVELAGRVAALEARLGGQAGPSMPGPTGALLPTLAPVRSPVDAHLVAGAPGPSAALPPASPPEPPLPRAPVSPPRTPASADPFPGPATAATADDPVFAAPAATGRDALTAFREATRSLPVSKLKNLDQFLLDATMARPGILVVYLKNDKLFKEGSDGYKALLPLVHQRFGEGTRLEIHTDPPGDRGGAARLSSPPSPPSGPLTRVAEPPEPAPGGPVPAPAPIAPATAASDPAPAASGDPPNVPPPRDPQPMPTPESDPSVPVPRGSATGDAVALASELLLGKVIEG